MIRGLFEAIESPRRSTRVDQCISDSLVEDGFIYMMRAGEGSKKAMMRQELESADV